MPATEAEGDGAAGVKRWTPPSSSLDASGAVVAVVKRDPLSADVVHRLRIEMR